MLPRIAASSQGSPASTSEPPPFHPALPKLAQLFKLLGDETRLQILEMLAKCDELCVKDMWERLGQSQPAVSHHLALLRTAGLLHTRQQGKHTFYAVDFVAADALLNLLGQTQLASALRARRPVATVRRPLVTTESTLSTHLNV
jgi:DNA-binding transcriptional ArsR family regulator